jgi:sterol desaturase/sphingolipid hydroxylase (fatty acid hydroxylase superfamily)
VLLGPVLSMVVHSGHEVFPAWWYRSPLTKWLLTPMYHDQHHQLYHCNYGGFMTLWDRAFGTMNPRFDEDFARFKAGAAGRAGAG